MKRGRSGGRVVFWWRTVYLCGGYANEFCGPREELVSKNHYPIQPDDAVMFVWRYRMTSRCTYASHSSRTVDGLEVFKYSLTHRYSYPYFYYIS